MKNLRIAYSAAPGFLGRAIRWFTRAPVSHTLFLVDVDGHDMVLDADWNGLVMHSKERAGGNIVAEPPLIKNIDSAIPYLLRELDAPYDYRGLIGMVWVCIGRWFHRRWRNPLQSPSALFCSEVAAQALKEAGYPGADRLDPGSTDPGSLLAFQREEWAWQQSLRTH